MQVAIGTDCAAVLSRAQSLQAHGCEKAMAHGFDNFDLWYLFCDVASPHEGNLSFFKVKAHVSGGDSDSPATGQQVTKQLMLPLRKWRDKFLQNLAVCRADLQQAVSIQAHLVRTLVAPARDAKLAPLNDVFSEDFPLSQVRLSRTSQCLCKPLARVRSKTSMTCFGSCHTFSVRYGGIEETFISMCSAGLPIPSKVSQALQEFYPAFARSLCTPGAFMLEHVECDIQSVIRGRRCISNAAASSLQSFLRLPIWCFHSSDQGCKVTWVQLVIEVLSRFGFQPGWLSPDMTAGILASRFRSVFLRLLCNNGTEIELASRCRHLSVFGLPNQAGFYGMVKYQSFHHQVRVLPG